MTIPAFVAERALSAATGQYLARPYGSASAAVTQAGPWCQAACELWCDSQGGDWSDCKRYCTVLCRGLPVTQPAEQ